MYTLLLKGFLIVLLTSLSLTVHQCITMRLKSNITVRVKTVIITAYNTFRMRKYL